MRVQLSARGDHLGFIDWLLWFNDGMTFTGADLASLRIGCCTVPLDKSALLHTSQASVRYLPCASASALRNRVEQTPKVLPQIFVVAAFVMFSQLWQNILEWLQKYVVRAARLGLPTVTPIR